MLTWVILGICLFLAVMLAGRWFANANPAMLAKILKWGVIGLIAVVALFFAVTGRLAFVAPLVAGGIWLLIRRSIKNTLFQAAAGAARAAGANYGAPSDDGTSEVHTEFVHMLLNHNSGEISGEVLKGKFKGASLAELSLSELVELVEICRSSDPQAVALLESYLDRTEGADWREKAGPAGAGDENKPRSYTGGMTREEALETLDLQHGASVDEIKEAHHRLMLKMHPDQGGSTYLASKINQAKDILLGS